jgi:hypothetical protein
MTHPDPNNRTAYLRHLAQVYGIHYSYVVAMAEGLGPRALSTTFLKELQDFNCFLTDSTDTDDNKED